LDFFQYLDANSYAKLAAMVAALPLADLVSDRSDCRDLVETICAAEAAPRLANRRAATRPALGGRLRGILRRAP